MRWISLLTLSLSMTVPVLVPAWAQTRQQNERPVDHGPFTPQANRAYEGGGVILEGAPGAPAPPPSAALDLPPNAPLPPEQQPSAPRY